MKSISLKIAVTVLILIALFWQVDIAAVFKRLGSISALTAILCVVIGLAQIAFLAWRWVLVARVQRMNFPFVEALRCMLAAQFFNQGLPASIGGDALRVWWLTRLEISLAVAMQNVLLDRLAGLVSLFV